MDKNSPCTIRTKGKMAASLKELMESMPFEKITVSYITDHCRVHRQTFYYHFADRYELLDWLIYNELIEPFVTGLTFDTMYEKFYQLFSTMYRDKKFYQNALKINSNDLSNYISKITRVQFGGLLTNMEAKTNITPENSETNTLVSDFFGFGISGVVIHWALRGMKESPEQMMRNIEEFVSLSKHIIEKRIG